MSSMQQEDTQGLPSRRGTPPPPGPPDEPEPEAMVLARVHAAANEVTAININQSGSATFDLAIITVNQTAANYDPENACVNLNAAIQSTALTHTGITPDPALFRVLYKKPRAAGSASDMGRFIVTVPKPLAPIYANTTFPIMRDGPLEFTGDDFGNGYKLKYEEHIRSETSQMPKIDEDTPWCHLIPNTDTEKTQRDLFVATQKHLQKFGFEIYDHPKAFRPILAKNKEQASGKYHCALKIKHAQIPRMEGGLYYLKGIDSVLVDEGPPVEYAKIWFQPDVLDKECNVCTRCFLTHAACPGHDRAPRAGGKSKMSAEEANAGAMQRIAKRAQKKFGF